MFRATLISRRISAYAMFIRLSKGLPKLKGLGPPQRGRKLAQMYRHLKAHEKALLQAKADKHPAAKSRRLSKKDLSRRTPHAFAKFVKANFAKAKGTTTQARMKAVAKMWHERVKK